jgi:hypothetical protein
MFGHWPVYTKGSLNLWISFQQCCVEILTSTFFLHLGCIPVRLSHNLLSQRQDRIFLHRKISWNFCCGTGGHVTVHNHSSTPQVDAWFLWCVFWFHLALKNVKPYSRNIALISSTTWRLWARALPKSSLHLGLASCTLISVTLSPLHEKCLLLCYLPGSYVLKSNSTGAQNVILQIKIRWRKVKTCWFGWEKWFWTNIFAQFAKSNAQQSPTCQRRVCSTFPRRRV